NAMKMVPLRSSRQGKSKAASLPANSLRQDSYGIRNQLSLRELVLLHASPQSIWQARRGESIETYSSSQSDAQRNHPRSEITASGGRRSRNNHGEQPRSPTERGNGGRTNTGRIHHER